MAATAETLKTLRRQRGKVQAAITGFTKKLDNWRDNAENRDPDLLQQNLVSLQKRFESFDSIQDQLEELDPSETEQGESVQDIFDEVVARAARYLREALHLTEVTSVGSNRSSRHESAGGSGQFGSQTSNYGIRLPKLNLPKFKGDISTWQNFYNLFIVSIHESTLKDVEKFQYLLSTLDGEAKDLVKGLAITEANYAVAWELLCSRYNCKRRHIFHHFNRFIELPELKHSSQLSSFITKIREHTQALNALGYDISQYDAFLVAVLYRKFSSHYRRRLDDYRGSDTDYPDVDILIKFLDKECLALDDTSVSTNERKETNFKALVAGTSNSPAGNNGDRKLCICCSEHHPLFKCRTFKMLKVPERWALLKQAGACFTCLKRDGHQAAECNSQGRCRSCNASHNTLLCGSQGAPHRPHQSPENTGSKGAPSAQATNSVALAAATDPRGSTPPASSLLGSALIEVLGGDGHYHTLRAVIDSAATCSFIKLSSAKRIGLKFERSDDPVSGIAGTRIAGFIKGHTTCYVKPRNSAEPLLPTETTVIKKIVDLPRAHITEDVKYKFSGLNLADPYWHTSNEVEFLTGVDIFPLIYTGEKKLGPPGVPAALNSVFGWIITGKIGSRHEGTHGPTALIATPSTDALLKRFWELEEVHKKSAPHPDDIVAEKIYKDGHYRDSDGRYVVPLLLRKDAPPLGDTRAMALHRLHGIERRLMKNPQLRNQYENFLQEYESLGHMKCVEQTNKHQAVVIPHHCVTRPGGKSLRVVFDASQKSSSGIALNDCVYSGPKLQNDVFDVILRFRIHQYVMTCDISKMYRQILIRPDERRFQHILWRKNGILHEFELKTVTYGVSSAPYLALRTVLQLISDEGHRFPLAARVLSRDRFVDDLATGSFNASQLIALQQEIIELLKLAGFEVQKWASNCSEILKQVPPEHCIASLDLSDETSILKILGIHWNAQSDWFFYDAQQIPHSVTKRNVLSQIARIYDPLGLISPIVFTAKAFMQKLWVEGVSWDSLLPEHLKKEWIQFYERLPAISSVRIKRCVTLADADFHSLVGFSDASKLGYAATVYLRSQTPNAVNVSLLAAKSKVAPTKTISIPRLELCGAQLLSNLLIHVREQLNEILAIDHIAVFTDSQIVLDWLKTLPCQLKTFEANRVADILDKIEPSAWRFVPSAMNPADLGSRGCMPDQLEQHPLWWTGPKWVSHPIDSWPNFENSIKKGPALALISTDNAFWDSLIAKHSSWSRLERIVAWVLRFVQNARQPAKNRTKTHVLSVHEINQSSAHLIKLIQQNHFSAEIKTLRTTGEIPKALRALHPFIDKEGVLRVGGRLENANMSFSSKHPALLPKHDNMVNLIIDAYHKKYLHAGPRLLQSLLARQFWIISARSIIRSRLSRCITCFHVRPTNNNPMMGNLPPARVNPARAFVMVSTDFGGPFTVREKRRNPKLTKAYLCLFTCMTTKAVHLEVVSELTTEAFLAAFDRFISRRGLCQKVLSDNATNYTGAKNHLLEVNQFFLTNKTTIEENLVERKIDWEFAPPAAPHFNGLAEAGIKSAKYHLKRIVGAQTLTFEELATVFTKIEAILNSRPLCQLSTDVSEIDVLTPGHFLIGGPLASAPEYDFSDTPNNRLSRWQLLQKFTQQFWKTWSRDYLHTLIQRTKWQHRPTNLQAGAVVLIADDDTPPLRWKKGIVEDIHPGKDGVVRVVTVRTARGVLKRGATKIYPLPQQ